MWVLSPFNIIILVLAVGINFLLSIIVFKNNPKSHTNLLLSTLCLVTSLWLVVTYISLSPTLFGNSLLWIRLSICLAVPQTILFFLLSKTLPHERIGISDAWLQALVVLGIGEMLITLSPYAFEGVIFNNGSPQPVPGPGIGFFVLSTILFSGLAIYTLVTKYTKSSGIAREQYRYVTVGMLAMLGLLVATVLIPVIFFKINAFVSFIPLYTLAFLGMTTYAIVKHRLLDIRVLVSRAVTFTILIALAGIVYSLLFSSLSALLYDIQFSSEIIGISTILSLTMAFSFPFVQRILEKTTRSIFFKDRYDSDALLYDLARIMASTFQLEQLTDLIIKQLRFNVRVTNLACILLDSERSVTHFKGEGFHNVLEIEDSDIKILCEGPDMIIFDELSEGGLKDVCRSYGFSVVVQMRVQGDQIGFLVLGEKQSGEIYSQQDLQILGTLSSELAVAIQNAKSYEEIQLFNVTLKKEVDHATTDLKKANEQLQELDKLKDEFVSLASHELRTPMTAIKGSLSTILDGYAGDISGESRAFLTAAYNENDRLIRLVNNLLNISRIEAGRFVFSVTDLDMDKLLTEVTMNLEIAAKEKSLKLRYDNEAAIPLVRADGDKVREVLINLIGNAIKFTHKGGVIVGASVHDNMVVTYVRDTGSGIAKEDQDLLFKKFSQVQGKNYAKQSGGTGLGLYICKQIIEGLHGKIWLESVLGQGSTFFFSLPVATGNSV